MKITTESELEELLSRPDDETASAMAAMDGDLLILGAGGKMGPSLARLARRAADQAGIKKRVIAVARFTNNKLRPEFAEHGIETMACDLLDVGALDKLPDVPNVIFMAARKFGTAGGEHLTWAMNTFLPGLVAKRYRDSRIVAFSTGNVYPLALTHRRRRDRDDSCRSDRRVCTVGAGPRAHVRIRIRRSGELRLQSCA